MINPITLNYILIFVYIGMAIVWGYSGNVKQAAYWSGAAVLTWGVTP